VWLTPVELFYPHYSNVMANFVSASMTSSPNNTTRCNGGVFDIVELGGGRGTNAIALLDHLSEYHPDAYARLRCYTIFDTSPTLHELQKEVLLDGSYHSDRVKLVNVDMTDIAEG
jgi:SAM-dependent MidA family methyltransferase